MADTAANNSPTDGEIRLALIHHAVQVAAQLDDPSSPEARDYLQKILSTPPEQVRAQMRPAG